jgi:hypothetical protein
MHGRIQIGTRVETIKPARESNDWTAEALAARKWGVSGKIIKEHDSHGLCYDVRHEDGTTGCYEPRELLSLDSTSYTPEERADMLRKMQDVSDNFYSMVTRAGCHALIEFTGLMNEFITVCTEAHSRGQQFPHANTHSGDALPFKPHNLAYLAEKLNCIYGPALLSNKECRDAFISTLFDGEFKLVPSAAPRKSSDATDLNP